MIALSALAPMNQPHVAEFLFVCLVPEGVGRGDEFARMFRLPGRHWPFAGR